MAGRPWYWQLPRQIGALFSGSSRPLQGSTEAEATTSRRLREEEELRPIFTFDDDDGSSFHDDDDDSYDDDDEEEAHKARPRVASSPRRRPRRRARRCLCSRVFRCAMFLTIIALAFTGYFFYKWNAEKARRVPWTPDPETKLFSKRPLPPSPQRLNITNYSLPLRTRGRNIVDTNGHRFKLASVNWYGASDELFVVGGLNVQHRDTIADTIKRLGFNSVRLPYADELVTLNPRIEDRLLSKNPDLVGMRAQDVFHAVTRSLTDEGIAVIINNHITSATWCCGADPCDAGWANDHLGPICRVRQTEEDWIRNWETIMRPHVDNPLVIGADLRNEVRGLWGTMPWSKWAAAAERCGNRLLKMNRDWLIVVEGTESANDVSGARERPVRLDVDNRLVYSAHAYSWSGWGSMAGRFSGRSYPSFVETMRWNWGYLLEGDVAPVWVGELGASHSPTVGGHNYWANLFRYLKAVDADFGYWALNPRKPRRNEAESYALVKDDYVTPILDYRMKDMMELMTQ